MKFCSFRRSRAARRRGKQRSPQHLKIQGTLQQHHNLLSLCVSVFLATSSCVALLNFALRSPYTFGQESLTAVTVSSSAARTESLPQNRRPSMFSATRFSGGASDVPKLSHEPAALAVTRRTGS